MNDDTEEFLDLISHNFFNKGKWRRKDQAGNSITKGRMMEAIIKMRKAEMDDTTIQDILVEIFNNAYVEHELQVKEGTGLSTKEFFIAKAKAQEPIIVTPIATVKDATPTPQP